MELSSAKNDALFNSHEYFYISLVAVVIILDLFLKLIPIWIFASIIFSYQILQCNKFENAFIFIPFAPIIAGAIFISRGISGIGGLFIPLGLVLILKDIVKDGFLLIKGYIPLFLVFILFAFSAYSNEGGQYYAIKILNTFIYGTLSYICFSIILINHDSVRFPLLAIIFLLWSAFFLRLVIDINNLPGPSSLFHFGFMREQTMTWGPDAFLSEKDFSISYHQPGFFALVGLSLFLTNSERSDTKLKLFIWIISFVVIFYTGARQNLLAYVVLLVFYIFTLDKYSGHFKYLSIGIVGSVFTLILLSINSDIIQNVLLSKSLSGAIEESGRSELIKKGFELYKCNPFWGIGFGHYNYKGIFDTYPHNLVVELLSEVGIFGVFLVSLLCVFQISSCRKKLYLFHKLNFKPYLILLPLFVRAMISGNLTLNIMVFSFVFSLTCLSLPLKE
jgi:hypothetical protein